MTARNEIAFAAPRRHGWKDAAVVAFLVVVLGAFVAELLTARAPQQARERAAAAAACQGARC